MNIQIGNFHKLKGWAKRIASCIPIGTLLTYVLEVLVLIAAPAANTSKHASTVTIRSILPKTIFCDLELVVIVDLIAD